MGTKMTLMEAYEVALRIIEQQAAGSQTTAGTFVDDRNQVRQIPNSTPFEHMPRDQRPAVELAAALPGLGGTPCLVHREKTHTFADGSTMESCSHSFCRWGKTHKRHSDRAASGTSYSPDIEVDGAEGTDDGETPSPDEPQELGVAVIEVAGKDFIEDDEAEQVERAADDAATDGDEDNNVTDEE